MNLIPYPIIPPVVIVIIWIIIIIFGYVKKPIMNRTRIVILGSGLLIGGLIMGLSAPNPGEVSTFGEEIIVFFWVEVIVGVVLGFAVAIATTTTLGDGTIQDPDRPDAGVPDPDRPDAGVPDPGPGDGGPDAGPA